MAARTDEFGGLIGPGSASHILEVSVESVKNFARAGKLPVVKTMDGRHLFPLAAVRELAAKRRASRGG